MTYYYAHAESGCAFLSQDPPEKVIPASSGCADLVDRLQYERGCKEFGIDPESHPDPCHETRRRIRLAVAAWAYEIHADPIMTDAEFDELALSVDLDRSTLRPDLDIWFWEHFSPDTAMWVHRHPEPEGLERIYQMMRGSRRSREASKPEAALLIWMIAA